MPSPTKPSRLLLFRFLANEGELRLRTVVLLGLTVSVGSLLALVAINAGAELLEHQDRDAVNWPLAGLFTVSIAMQFFGQKHLIASVCAATELAIDKVRIRLVEGVRHADFASIERIGSDTLFEGITQTSSALSQNSPQFALSLSSSALATLILLYILYLSAAAFATIVAGAAVAAWMYHRLGSKLRMKYLAMFGQERVLFATVEDFLNGFREVRMWSRRASALKAQFLAACERATAARLAVQNQSVVSMIFGQTAMFFLLALVVFVVPSYMTSFSADVIKVTSAVVFLIGPLGATIQAVSVLAAAEAAASRMLELDAQLHAIRDPAVDGQGPAIKSGFEEIVLSGVGFGYASGSSETRFALAELNLRISRNEVIFITGGNGSGKTSFLKLLTGLYRPASGTLSVDGSHVTHANRQSFRELFGAVWSGQHLARRLHGLGSPDSEQVRALLEWMEIHDIVTVDGDRLSRTELSSGQKKRVQLVAALLENRPLLVLDEWAADQDPHFRQKFYREVIPELRRRGLTVIAVTHDDRYFDAADRRIHFEQGRMSEIKLPEQDRRATA